MFLIVWWLIYHRKCGNTLSIFCELQIVHSFRIYRVYWRILSWSLYIFAVSSAASICWVLHGPIVASCLCPVLHLWDLVINMWQQLTVLLSHWLRKGTISKTIAICWKMEFMSFSTVVEHRRCPTENVENLLPLCAIDVIGTVKYGMTCNPQEST